MVEKEVLAIQRDTEILVELVADADDETPEVQGILLHVVIGQEPLKHPKGGQLGAWNMVMAHEVETKLTRPSVVLKSLVDRGLRPEGSEDGITRGRLCAGCVAERRRFGN